MAFKHIIEEFWWGLKNLNYLVQFNVQDLVELRLTDSIPKCNKINYLKNIFNKQPTWNNQQ